MVQGADGCTMVTGASDSIGPMTPQPLRFMCSGAVLPLQCFTLGVPTARHPADLWATLLYNAVVPCWRTFRLPTALYRLRDMWQVRWVQLSWAAGAALPRKVAHKIQNRLSYL